MLHASVLSGQVKQGELDHAINIYKQSILPVLQAQAGFIRSILLCNPDTQQFISIFYWGSMVELLAGEASAYLQAQLREMRVLLKQPLVNEHYVVRSHD